MDQNESSQISFYYEFRADFVVLDSKSEIKFIKPQVEQFVNENPIIARENALMRYRNYIDVILQSIGKSYVSDRKARKDLIEYYDAIYERSMPIGENEISLSKSLSCRIGVYLINNSPEYLDEKAFREECEKEYGELIDSDKTPFLATFELYYSCRKLVRDDSQSYLIHGIEYFNGKDLLDPWLDAKHLDDEFHLYWKERLDYGNYKTEIQVWNDDDQLADEFEILETPFDWDGYDQPHPEIEVTPPKDKKGLYHPTTLQELINLGESKTMEFKPAIFYDHSKGKGGSGLPCAIAIAAFLNAEGGILCVGVDNYGKIKGIEFDLSITTSDIPEDGLKLLFDKMVYNFFPPFVQNYLDTKYATIDGKRLFFVIVRPSDQPVFIRIYKAGVTDKHFYFRRQASNEQLVKLEEFYDYVKIRWFSQGNAT